MDASSIPPFVFSSHVPPTRTTIRKPLRIFPWGHEMVRVEGRKRRRAGEKVSLCRGGIWFRIVWILCGTRYVWSQDEKDRYDVRSFFIAVLRFLRNGKERKRHDERCYIRSISTSTRVLFDPKDGRRERHAQLLFLGRSALSRPTAVVVHAGCLHLATGRTAQICLQEWCSLERYNRLPLCRP